MKFADFVCSEAIIPQLKAETRDQAIEELIVALEKAGKLQDGQTKKLLKSVIKRENEASTGMGKGVAVPHVKHNDIKNVIAAVGNSVNGIDFSSLDKQPVYSIFLLLSPNENPDSHLQAMEVVFKNLQEEKFRKWLRQSESAKQIEDLLEDADNQMFL